MSHRFHNKQKKHSKKNRIYNIHIRHEQHDEEVKMKFQYSNIELPKQHDLSKNNDYIYDQSSIGSCTANSLCWGLKMLDNSFNPSRLFLYYNSRLFDEREGDNSVVIDDGTTIKQGINVLLKKGICSESIWPYDITKFADKPNENATKDAINHRLIKYNIINQDINSMKQCLYNGYPFTFGIYLFESFEDDDTVDDTGIIPLPNKETEELLGGHALIAVGYDDEKRLIKFANSWGRGWGDNGYGYIPYDYILDDDLTDDLWVLTDISKPVIIPTPPPKKPNNNKRPNNKRPNNKRPNNKRPNKNKKMMKRRW